MEIVMDKHSNTQVDKFEQRREDTEKRISSMKTKDGHKKPIQSGSKLGKILFPIVIVILSLVILVWVAFALGLPRKFAHPIKIGSNPVSVLEYNYYFKAQVNQWGQAGLIPKNKDGSYNLTGTALLDKNQTWQKYLEDKTNSDIQSVYIQSEKAKQEGLQLDPQNKTIIDTFFENLKKQYGSDIDVTNHLVDQFGKGATVQSMRPIFERAFLANQYETHQMASYKIPADKVEAYYKEHQTRFDVTNYRMMTFTPQESEDLPKNASEAEKRKAKEEASVAAKKQAEAMFDKVTTADKFNKLAAEYALKSQQSAYESDPDHSLYSATDTSVADKTIAKWLFDKNRKPNDKTLLESNGNYYVICFISRKKDMTVMPTVRHILFEAQKGKASKADLAKAEKLAEETIAKITDEASMEKIGDQLQKDGIAREARKYSEIKQGKMVPEFNNWIYDPARKPGDKAIVQTSYGYHIIYFIKWSDHPAWYQQALKDLENDKFQKEMDELKKSKEFAIHVSSFGMRFIND